MNPQILKDFIQQNTKNTFAPKYPDDFDPKWLIAESGWPWFKLSALENENWKAMYNEAEMLLDHFHSHREESTGQGWKSLTLHGLNEDTQSLEQYGEDRLATLKKLHWTWVADQCPVTKRFLEDVWPAEYLNRVRFMLLEPGGYILPHRDRPSGQTRLSVCNISLNMPQDCEMIIEGYGAVPFDDSGSAVLLDVSNQHAVVNNSNKPRIHIIVHYEIGRGLRDMFYLLRKSYFKNRATDDR